MAVVGFIGTGNMGSAIARAAGKSNQVDRLLLANRSPKKAQVLAQVLDATAVDNETAAKCIYVGMSAGIAGPLLTTPGADFDDDRELALRAGYAVSAR